ncbi:DUF1887 family protein [Salinimonas sp. HHU 13199]|uniref:DUF1887 family protein n=1 Tax=Salinimonas profundi TaxID=2729140 RepID=A0ABR8LMQ2_9ALTE|nr:DUF1887 family CARF protein [Salinimonas profundi]MBD3587474.1 DUF1887 family protein [Salinimonas profundi]
MTTTHVCLLNDSVTSVLTPVIDPSIPSDALIIAGTSDYESHAQQLIRLAKTRGFKASYFCLPDTAKTAQIKDAFLELFSRVCESGEGEVWLNASAGDRYHVLAAFEVARAYDCPVFVVEPAQDELYWLHPEDRAPTPIDDRLKLHEYFTLFDATLTGQENTQGVSKPVRELGESWAKDIEECAHALRALNYLASEAGESLRVPMEQQHRDDTTLTSMLWELEALDYVRIDNNTLIFSNEKARFFCNGGWLEEHTYAVLNGVTTQVKSIQDAAHGAQITRKINGKTLSNELDVIALANNKLHIIECKTQYMEALSSTNTLYKLDSLNELLGGLEGRAALVTYFDVTPSARLRATELGIRIFGSQEIPQLKHHLANWLEQA